MSGVFLKILNMSIAAGWLIAVLLLLRPLLKKAPRRLLCLLWALAALRLALPFALQSPVSLVPSANTVSVDPSTAGLDFDTGFYAVNSFMGAAFDAVDPPAAVPVESTAVILASSSGACEPVPTVPRSFDAARAASVVWLCGVCAMACYGLISYALLLRRVRASVREGGVFLCDDIKSPFILGVFRPRIYVPSGLSGRDIAPVLAHERAHISRGDHIWKPLGYALLCVHWFDPLVWLAYYLFCRDVEAACDERVIRDMEREERAAYSEALLRLSAPGSAFAACPLAFGEISVKDRVKNVLSYKKPAFWVLVVFGVVLIGLGAAFLTDPVRRETRCFAGLISGDEYRVGMSEASARSIGRLVSRQKLTESGSRKGSYRITVGEKEYYYEPESGVLYDPAKQLFTTVDDRVRREINFLLGIGAVTETRGPDGSGCRIRPLLMIPYGDALKITLEISVSRETNVPNYACVFEADRSTLAAVVKRSSFPYSGVTESAVLDFELPFDSLSKAGIYYFCMYDDYLETPAVDASARLPIMEFNPERYIGFSVEGLSADAELRLYHDADTLIARCPDYGSLDVKHGLNVYVTGVEHGYEKRYLSCCLAPGDRTMDTFELMTYVLEPGRRLTVDEALELIAYYEVPETKVRVTGYVSPLSSTVLLEPVNNDMLRRVFFPSEEPQEANTEAPAVPGFPKAVSLDSNVALTVAAWDLGEGAQYAEGYSADSVKLPSAPCLAVVWKNLGSENFSYGTLVAMEYLTDGGAPERVSDSTFYDLPLYVLLPGVSKTQTVRLDGFDLSRHGRYRLWLNVSFRPDGEISPKTYYVDMYL